MATNRRELAASQPPLQELQTLVIIFLRFLLFSAWAVVMSNLFSFCPHYTPANAVIFCDI